MAVECDDVLGLLLLLNCCLVMSAMIVQVLLMQYLERPELLRLLIPTPNITGFPAEIKIVKNLFPISMPCPIQKTHIKPRG